MKLSENQIRSIIREIITELFVRPKHRKLGIKKMLSNPGGLGYDDDYLGGDIGFGEFDESDDDLDDENPTEDA
jgi:hypothetical protein